MAEHEQDVEARMAEIEMRWQRNQACDPDEFDWWLVDQDVPWLLAQLRAARQEIEDLEYVSRLWRRELILGSQSHLEK